MRVGVYVDGFNVYYGGRGLCGRGTAGWRWLDLRALASNPTPSYLAGDLKGKPDDGVGGHWWRQLVATDLTSHQLPNPAGGYSRPAGW